MTSINMTLITPQLALGELHDPVKYGEYIDAFLCCAAELSVPRKKPTLHLFLKDGLPIGAEFLNSAFGFLDEQLQAKRLILVYCGHGTSRSASILVGYLAIKTGNDLYYVLSHVHRLRPEIAPSPVMLQSIARYVKHRQTNQT